MSSNSKSPRVFAPRAQGSIRDSTMQLSSLPLKSPLSVHFSETFIFPTTSLQVPAAGAEDRISIAASLSSALTADSASDVLSSSAATASSTNTAAPLSRERVPSTQPSGLSLLRPQRAEDEAIPTVTSEESLPTPTMERPYPVPHQHAPLKSSEIAESSHSTAHNPPRRYSERSHLLGDVEALRATYTTNGHTTNGNGHVQPEAVGKRTSKGTLAGWGSHLLKGAHTEELKHVPALAVKALPAVILGTLLNILDGISYGMLVFPAAGVFTGLGGVGVSMFFVS